MSAVAATRTRMPRARYLRARRAVYHILGGEGHSDWRVKLIDYALVFLITVNCIFSVLESVENLAIVHGHIFHAFDRISVFVFSIEYVLRIWTAVESSNPKYHHRVLGRLRAMVTPMLLVDLVAILPFYLSMFLDVDLRAMRVLRLMRVFKLTRYSYAMVVLLEVLKREVRALSALLFIFSVMLVFVSSLMYMFEHPAQPKVFSDIPSSMWWAVVTMTTLGYGDMVPATTMGRVLGACTAILGVGMIALPAGILASGFGEAIRLRREEYVEAAQRVGDRRSRRQRQELEEARVALGMTQEEAAELLKKAAKARKTNFCPHCGEKLDPY